MAQPRAYPVVGFQGVHEHLPPTVRPLNVPSAMSNLVLSPAPSLATRPGLTALGSAVAAVVTRGIHQFIDIAGTTVQTIAQAGCVLKRWDGSTWQSINAGTVSSITITAGGSGYTSPPTVAFAGGGGSGAAGTAVLSAGAVASVTITNAGTGYTSTPTVSFSGGGGSGATGTVVMTVPDTNMQAANLNDLACLFWAGYAPRKWDGSSLAALGGTPPQGEFVTEAYGILFVCGIPGREGDVDWCDDEDPETWTPAAANNAGSATVSQSPTKWTDFDSDLGKVLIWTTKELRYIAGPETGDRPSLWSIRTAVPYGTPCGRTVRNVNGIWVWLTTTGEKNGFALWNGGSAQVVHDPIKTNLALIDWSNIANSTSWLDEDGRYVCSVPQSGSGTLWFMYDPELQEWFTGSGGSMRATGILTVSGEDVFVVGNEVGQIYKATGTDDGGTDITWSLTVGPTVFGDPFVDHQLSLLDVAMSAETDATVNAAIAPSEGGAYGTSRSLSVGTEITHVRVPLPIESGEPRLGGVWRMKLSGTGVVTIHGVQPAPAQAGR